jgi:proteic killer suppression protein
VIRSFKDKETEKVWNQTFSKKLPTEIQRTALRKLIILHRAKNLEDLRIPPSNYLERLKGNRKGQYSIRINIQWRICFTWKEDEAFNVEVTDYH